MKTAADFRHLEIPDVATFADTPGGLVRLDIATSKAKAEVFLYGAHVTHFQPAGQPPVLFLAKKSFIEPGKAIRGGVPLIFPWFGPRAGHPAHGFVRTAEWALESLAQSANGDVVVVLSLSASDATRAAWAYDFIIRHRITVSEALEMVVEVENASPVPFTYEDALHTYFTVADALDVTVSGLDGAEYLDGVDGGQRKRQVGSIRIEKETDRLYLNTATTCVVDDPSLHRRIVVEKSGSYSTVVWNPWAGKGMSMADLAEEWPGMICIETVNARENAVTLAPGERHATRQFVRVEGR